MNITLFSISTKHFAMALYITSAWRGCFNSWRQKSPHYKRGFVARLLWLGFAIRQGHKPQRSRTPFEQVSDLLIRLADLESEHPQ